MGARRLTLGRRCGLHGWFGFLRHHQRAQLGVRCENAVVRAAGVRSLRAAKLRGHQTDQVQPGPWHQRSQPLHELQRRQPCRPRPRRARALRLAQTVHWTVCVPPQHQVGGAVARGGLELEHDLPGGVGFHALVGQSRARTQTVRWTVCAWRGARPLAGLDLQGGRVMVRHSCSSPWPSSAPQRTAITSRARATADGITSTDRPRLT